MMRINLLALPGAKEKGREPSGPVSPARHAVVFIVALLACSSVVGFFHWTYKAEIKQLQDKKKKAEDEKKRLAGFAAQLAAYEQRYKQLEQRKNTIDMLQASKVGPVDLMNSLGTTVNKTNDLYLVSVTSQGNNLTMRGQANSVDGIAEFLNQLQRSGSFDQVNLRQAFQDDQQERVTFKFNLDCVYKPPPTAAPATGVGAQQPAAAPAARRAGT